MRTSSFFMTTLLPAGWQHSSPRRRTCMCAMSAASAAPRSRPVDANCASTVRQERHELEAAAGAVAHNTRHCCLGQRACPVRPQAWSGTQAQASSQLGSPPPAISSSKVSYTTLLSVRKHR